MPNEHRLTVRLRLEDAVALAFFLINLAMRVVFRGFERGELSPADVLIIIPAISLLLTKEVVHYFVAGASGGGSRKEALRAFVHPYWVIVRDWFPFLVILLMYYSLWGDATHLLVTHDRDALLIRWDQRLFGLQASVALERFVTPWLTAWMCVAYVFHIFNIPIVACFIYLRRSKERFREMMCGVLVVCFFGLLGYPLVPAVGPIYSLASQYAVPLTTPFSFINLQVEFMNFARIRRDVFPSMHVGISFLVWLYAFRNSRKLFWILLPLILSLWVSTVYLRYHYLVDLLAGFLLAPPCFWLANRLFRRVGETAFQVSLPAAWHNRLREWGVCGAGTEAAGKAEERP